MLKHMGSSINHVVLYKVYGSYNCYVLYICSFTCSILPGMTIYLPYFNLFNLIEFGYFWLFGKTCLVNKWYITLNCVCL